MVEITLRIRAGCGIEFDTIHRLLAGACGKTTTRHLFDSTYNFQLQNPCLIKQLTGLEKQVV